MVAFIIKSENYGDSLGRSKETSEKTIQIIEVKVMTAETRGLAMNRMRKMLIMDYFFL